MRYCREAISCTCKGYSSSVRLISRVTLNLLNKKAAVSQPAQRGGAGVGQLPHYLFCCRQTKSLKTRRKAASPTPGIARGLLHERPCSPATCCSIVNRHTASGYPGLLKHRSRPSLPSTQPRISSKPPPLPHSPAHSMCFGVFSFL